MQRICGAGRSSCVLYPGRIEETHTEKEGYRIMKKHLTLPGAIILQFLQDNEEGMRQITKHNFKKSTRGQLANVSCTFVQFYSKFLTQPKSVVYNWYGMFYLFYRDPGPFSFLQQLLYTTDLKLFSIKLAHTFIEEIDKILNNQRLKNRIIVSGSLSVFS